MDKNIMDIQDKMGYVDTDASPPPIKQRPILTCNNSYINIKEPKPQKPTVDQRRKRASSVNTNHVSIIPPSSNLSDHSHHRYIPHVPQQQYAPQKTTGPQLLPKSREEIKDMLSQFREIADQLLQSLSVHDEHYRQQQPRPTPSKSDPPTMPQHPPPPQPLPRERYPTAAYNEAVGYYSPPRYNNYRYYDYDDETVEEYYTPQYPLPPPQHPLPPLQPYRASPPTPQPYRARRRSYGNIRDDARGLTRKNSRGNMHRQPTYEELYERQLYEQQLYDQQIYEQQQRYNYRRGYP